MKMVEILLLISLPISLATLILLFRIWLLLHDWEVLQKGSEVLRNEEARKIVELFQEEVA